MMNEVFVNGAWRSLESLSGKLLEPLWTEGAGLIETMRWEHQRFALKTYHEKRIIQSLKLLQWPSLKLSLLWEQIHQALRLKQLEKESLKIRLTFFPSSLKPNNTDWLMQVGVAPALGKPNNTFLTAGIKTMPVDGVGSFLGLKSINRLPYQFLSRNQKNFETLWNHPEWGLSEGTISNIWLWMGQNRWLIPPPLGQVRGVMHQWLLDYSHSQGWEVKQQHLMAEVCKEAKGLWLTNALRGILAVDELDGKKLNSPNPDEVLECCFKPSGSSFL